MTERTPLQLPSGFRMGMANANETVALWLAATDGRLRPKTAIRQGDDRKNAVRSDALQTLH
jgi:hypothetical protein